MANQRSRQAAFDRARALRSEGKNVAGIVKADKDSTAARLPNGYVLTGFDAVRNAIMGRWSNGQTEGQINRLKTLKRAMYGWAGPELLRARMLPL